MTTTAHAGLHQAPLAQISQRCAETTANFFKHQDTDNRFCFELFRRAFAERNQPAWEYVYAQYQALVTGWVQAHGQFALSGEEAQYFVNGAFMNMAKACTPEKFAQFANLRKLLAYLKACVHTVIVNHVRSAGNPPTAELPESLRGGQYPLEQMVLTDMQRAECWRLVHARLQDDKERIVIEHCFVLGVKPRQVYEHFSDRFSEVREVYRMKRNILDRLQRDPELKRFVGEFML